MKRSTEATPVVKTSISLPKVLIEFADDLVESDGYNSRSDLLAALLRKHKSERELHAIKLKELNISSLPVKAAAEAFYRAEQLANATHKPSPPKSKPHRGTSGRTSGGNA